MKKKLIQLEHLSPLEKRKAPWAYIFLLPWFALFAVFFAYPLGYGLVVSFFDYNLKGMTFNGIQNYIDMLHPDHYQFWLSLAGMLRYAVIQIPLGVFIPLWIANVIKDHGKGFTNFTKVMIYLPGVLCSAAVVIVWKFMFNPAYGMFSEVLKTLSGDPMFSLWNDPNWAIPVIAIMVALSGLGGNLIIYAAALNNISPDYYDAAELDGASRSQQFTKITIPLVKPTVLYCLVTGTIGSLQIFVIPKLLTAGGPNYKTSTLLLMIYNYAFVDNKFGYASACAMILFVITAIVAVIQFRMSKDD